MLKFGTVDANANEKSFSLKCFCANSWHMQLLVRRRDKQNKEEELMIFSSSIEIEIRIEVGLDSNL